VIVGLRDDTAQIFINDIGQRIRDGETFETGVDYSDLAKGTSVRFSNVLLHQFPEYIGFALWFYRGEPFSAIQMVWPDRSGAFPWEPAFAADLRAVQPLLDRIE